MLGGLLLHPVSTNNQSIGFIALSLLQKNKRALGNIIICNVTLMLLNNKWCDKDLGVRLANFWT